jgi:hypothetical protein
MSPNRSVKSLYSWKPLGARPVGRPKTRWEHDVKGDIKVQDWKITVQESGKVWLRRPKLYASCSVKEEEIANIYLPPPKKRLNELLNYQAA